MEQSAHLAARNDVEGVAVGALSDDVLAVIVVDLHEQ